MAATAVMASCGVVERPREMGNTIWTRFSVSRQRGDLILACTNLIWAGIRKGPKISNDKQKKNRTLPRNRIFGFLRKFSPRKFSLRLLRRLLRWVGRLLRWVLRGFPRSADWLLMMRLRTWGAHAPVLVCWAGAAVVRARCQSKSCLKLSLKLNHRLALIWFISHACCWTLWNQSVCEFPYLMVSFEFWWTDLLKHLWKINERSTLRVCD